MSEREFLNRASVEEALKRLNMKMVYEEMTPINMVSCGGGALNLLGLINRPTTDLDIIGLAKVDTKSKLRIEFAKTLPPRFSELIAEIGRELRLRHDWLNLGPSVLLDFGLPPGFDERLVKKSYGECLTLFVISRLDQIHLKMFAAMDPKGGRSDVHLSDLMDLEPDEKEAMLAVKWLLDRSSSDDFKSKLKEVLERIGHEGITRKF